VRDDRRIAYRGGERRLVDDHAVGQAADRAANRAQPGPRKARGRAHAVHAREAAVDRAAVDDVMHRHDAARGAAAQ
jgi:hypothetical protein